MEETYEKIIYNLYNLISFFYDGVKQQVKLEPKSYEEYKQTNEKKEQLLAEYEISVYKNIEYKLLKFAQILNKKQKTAYTLDKLETETIRHYIGLYNEGKRETIEEISNKLNKSKNTINKALETALTEMLNPFFQEQLLYERDEIIKEGIKNKLSKEILLKQDIKFLLMTENMENILRMERINTIDDLLKINWKTIYNLNIQYGYNTEFSVFPKRIIRQIYNFGLEFKNKKIIENILEAYEKLEAISLESMGINDSALFVETVYDLICAQQFEPELLSIHSLYDRLHIDGMITDKYKQTKLFDFIEKINQIKYKEYYNKTNSNSIKSIIEKENPYLNEDEIELLKEDMSSMFEIKDNYGEEEKEFLKMYFLDKN